MTAKDYLNEALSAIDKGEFEDFTLNLSRLHAVQTCNCVFSEVEKSAYHRLVEVISQYKDSVNFNSNLAKGFAYLRANYQPEAYKYLSIAIEKRPWFDISYSLRATLHKDVNPNFLEDAQFATLLDPSARNYFVLAEAYESAENWRLQRHSLVFYNNAISLNPNFPCAYNSKALVLKRFNEYDRAIDCFKKCIELQNNHWAYSELCSCLVQKGRNTEAIEYAFQGLQYFPNDIEYQLILGDAYFNLKYFKQAIEHYGVYLKTKPDSDHATYFLQEAKIECRESTLRKARLHYEQGKYNDSLECFEEVLKEIKYLYSDDLAIYFKSYLKIENQDILLDQDSPIYKSINSLRSSYSSKQYNGKTNTITKDEANANKLVCYDSDTKINFGKHKGLTIENILNTDPNYLLWCVIHLDHFLIELSWFLVDNLKAQSQYVRALEYALAKSYLLDEEEGLRIKDEQDEILHQNFIDAAQGDWGGLYGEEADTGYWNTE